MIHLRAKHWFLFFAAALFALTVYLTGQLGNTHTTGGDTLSMPSGGVIIIDPGHGGFDGGAVGVNGTVEKDVNLAISLKLRDMLTQAGLDVVMTRETDEGTNDEGKTTIRQKKISDIRNRLNLTKLYPGSTLVSIHQNKLEGGSARGAQIFYSPNQPSSKELAQSIQNEFNRDIQPDKPREIVKTGKNIYLFYHAQNTAVLCECGFLSNAQEEALLNTDEYQYRVANCIYRGILSYRESLSNQ